MAITFNSNSATLPLQTNNLNNQKSIIFKGNFINDIYNASLSSSLAYAGGSSGTFVYNNTTYQKGTTSYRILDTANFSEKIQIFGNFKKISHFTDTATKPLLTFKINDVTYTLNFYVYEYGRYQYNIGAGVSRNNNNAPEIFTSHIAQIYNPDYNVAKNRAIEIANYCLDNYYLGCTYSYVTSNNKSIFYNGQISYENCVFLSFNIVNSQGITVNFRKQYPGEIYNNSIDFTAPWGFLNVGTFTPSQNPLPFCPVENFLKNANFGQYSPEAGLPSAEGGYAGGTFDDSSDTISLPDIPSFGMSSTGFINVYAPTQHELIQLGAELFPATPQMQTADDIVDALYNLGVMLDNFVQSFQNAKIIDYILDCHLIPVAPTVSEHSNVEVGFKVLNTSCAKATSDYVDVDCGTLNVGEYYGNFADYGAFTQAKLYLPFVGFVPIQNEYWQSGYLNVYYRFNIIDGSFMVFIRSSSSKSKLTNTVIAQYSGTCCVHVPITGTNYAQMMSGQIGAAAATVSNAMGGNVSGAVSSALETVSYSPPMQSSNSYNATTSFLGVRTPYLVIERSVSNFSQDYAKEQGIPSNITTKFSKLTGFTKATVEHLDGIPDATEAELQLIADALAQGVIF